MTMLQEPLLSAGPSRRAQLDDDGSQQIEDQFDPMLPPQAEEDLERQQQPQLQSQDPYYPIDIDTFWSTAMNLSKAILGAGVMVLPKAFQLLGAVSGTLVLILVALITWYTISGLVYAAEKAGKSTYASVVRSCSGRLGWLSKWVLLLAVIANCFGLMAAYIVICGDVLVGSDATGLIPELLPNVDPNSWFMGRQLVTAAVTALVLTPLATKVSLHGLRMVNIFGVLAVMVFAASTVALAAAAVAQGVAYPMTLMPDWSALGETRRSAALSIMGVVAIVLNADICHQAVFPAMTLLRPYSRQRMNAAVAVALAVCTILYLAIAVCTCLVFGPHLDGDVLNNLSATAMAPLIGELPAHATAGAVRAAYLVSLVGSYALTMHPLRHCCMELLLGHRYHSLTSHESHLLFYPLTLGLMAAQYAVAVFVPSIWVILSLVGSSTATLVGFIFPGLVILGVMRKPRWTHTAKRVAAVGVVAVGAVLFVNGFLVYIL